MTLKLERVELASGFTTTSLLLTNDGIVMPSPAMTGDDARNCEWPRCTDRYSCLHLDIFEWGRSEGQFYDRPFRDSRRIVCNSIAVRSACRAAQFC